MKREKREEGANAKEPSLSSSGGSFIRTMARCPSKGWCLLFLLVGLGAGRQRRRAASLPVTTGGFCSLQRPLLLVLQAIPEAGAEAKSICRASPSLSKHWEPGSSNDRRFLFSMGIEGVDGDETGNVPEKENLRLPDYARAQKGSCFWLAVG